MVIVSDFFSDLSTDPFFFDFVVVAIVLFAAANRDDLRRCVLELLSECFLEEVVVSARLRAYFEGNISFS